MHEKSHNVLIKGLSGRLIIQLTYKFRVILIAFCWVFHVFRSDRWLIYVVWVIHYLIINIKRRFLQGGGDCTAGHNFSRDHKNKSAYKSTDSGQRKCTKSNKSLELPSFIWFGKASSTSESHYISMYFAFRYHTTSLLLSLSLSLSLQPAVSPLISPIQKETIQFHLARWQWCMSLMESTFQVLSL